jgi:hypothetical protein
VADGTESTSDLECEGEVPMSSITDPLIAYAYQVFCTATSASAVLPNSTRFSQLI